MDKLRKEISQIIRETLSEEFPSVAPVAAQAPEPVAAPVAAPIQIQPKMIRFNKGLEDEYKVLFSERGFSIEGDETRMSFEELHNAISKEYAITLKSGFILDAVKMQQILKYKKIV